MFINKYPYTDFHELNLDWILKNIHHIVKSVEDLNAWKTQHEAEYQQLYDYYSSLMDGDLSPELISAISDWCQNNRLDLVGDLVHLVFFGIDMDGYFVVYMPESWNDVTFGTSGLDDFPAGIEYGHLTLTY